MGDDLQSSLTPEPPYRNFTAALLRRTMTRRHWMARVAMFGTAAMAPFLVKLGTPATVLGDFYCNVYTGPCGCSTTRVYGCSPNGQYCGTCSSVCGCGACCCCCWWCTPVDLCCCPTGYPQLSICNGGEHACANFNC